ncbi:MAG: acetate--CoA ligase family protein, partial [Deltaproteobacteria bacterium]|nr:acetate--CoA ligase family protein [Deltaproteobacteria bacterium]
MTRTLPEHEAETLIAARGLPVAPGAIATTFAEAAVAASRLGWPVALKVSSAAHPHKTESRGVALGIACEDALRAAWDEMAPRFPGDPLLVQRMAPPGLEMIVGARRDPVFGPVVAVGIGGVAVEALGDVAVRACPVNDAEAGRMLVELKAAALLGPFRGRPAVDRGALCAFVAGLSRLAAERRDLGEIECNPVIAHASGVVAVDALARIDDEAEARPADDGVPVPGQGMAGFFRPASVAVVGASEKPGKGGTVVLGNLRTHGFAGRLYAVHPSMPSVQGVPAYPSIAALPEVPELVVAVVPRDHIPGVARDCAARGVPGLIVVSGGFGDVGGPGKALEDEVARVAREGGVRLMGPNSIGTIDASSGVVTSITTLPAVPRGGAAYVGQTGVFASGFASALPPAPGGGMNKVACLGNKADVCETDVLAFYGDDPTTRAVGVYLEGVKRPARFIQVLRRVAAAKPVVILKGGGSRSGAEAVASHTGALAGDRRVFDAAVRQAGAFVAAGFEEMFDVVKAFALAPVPAGGGLGVVSISGVGCVLAADRAESEGVTIPPLAPATEAAIRAVVPAWAPVRNPVDIWSAIEASGAAAAYEGVASAVLDQADVQALMLGFV